MTKGCKTHEGIKKNRPLLPKGVVESLLDPFSSAMEDRKSFSILASFVLKFRGKVLDTSFVDFTLHLKPLDCLTIMK